MLDFFWGWWYMHIKAHLRQFRYLEQWWCVALEASAKRMRQPPADGSGVFVANSV